MSDPRTVRIPPGGVWRVGRVAGPLSTRPPDPLDLADSDAGNRWDAVYASAETVYFGTATQACFAETLAGFRPDPAVVELVKDTAAWTHHMEPGAIDVDWRANRNLVRAVFDPAGDFVDITAHETIAWINSDPHFKSIPIIAQAGSGLTLSHLTADDRVVTRLLASIIHELKNPDGQHLYQGIRYESKHGQGLECWAVFRDRVLTMTAIDTKTIEKNDPGLEAMASLFGLTIH